MAVVGILERYGRFSAAVSVIAAVSAIVVPAVSAGKIERNLGRTGSQQNCRSRPEYTHGFHITESLFNKILA